MKNMNHNQHVVRIVRYVTPNYKSIIEVRSKNKNFIILKKIDSVLRKNNKFWSWLITNSDITDFTWETYISGKENISLLSIEKIANLLSPFIQNPKDIMNYKFVNLKYGKEYELNLSFIIQKYGIRQSEITNSTTINRSEVSRYCRGLAKQLNTNHLTELFHFFTSRGVPLRSVLDLFYFPNWGEKPESFIVVTQKKRGRLFKQNSKLELVGRKGLTPKFVENRIASSSQTTFSVN